MQANVSLRHRAEGWGDEQIPGRHASDGWFGASIQGRSAKRPGTLDFLVTGVVSN